MNPCPCSKCGGDDIILPAKSHDPGRRTGAFLINIIHQIERYAYRTH
jgi:hypothetical protein